ncbi:MAG: LuxR C-terminal-related transcriptional regulator [Bacillota bacterium]
MEKIRVLVADKNPLLKQGMRKLFEQDESIDIVGEAATNDDCVEQCRALAPDIVVMDVNLAGITAVEAIKHMKRDLPAVEVIVLTMQNNREYILETLKAGAIGYILKDVGSSELIRAIQVGSTGKSILHPKIATKLVQEITRLAERTPAGRHGDTAATQLTPREREVLVLVARGLTNQEIADRLFISEKTVRNHISNLLRKLKLKHRTQAAVYAIKAGVVRLDEPLPPAS